MALLIAYCNTETLIVDDLVPCPVAGEIPARAGYVGRLAHDNAVALGWRWSAESEGFVPPVPVPAQVSMRQARLALLGLGLLDSVNAVIAAIPDAMERRAVQLAWEYSSAVDRHDPLIEGMASSLGMSAQQLDELFRLAATL